MLSPLMLQVELTIEPPESCIPQVSALASALRGPPRVDAWEWYRTRAPWYQYVLVPSEIGRLCASKSWGCPHDSYPVTHTPSDRGGIDLWAVSPKNWFLQPTHRMTPTRKLQIIFWRIYTPIWKPILVSKCAQSKYLSFEVYLTHPRNHPPTQNWKNRKFRFWHLFESPFQQKLRKKVHVKI